MTGNWQFFEQWSQFRSGYDFRTFDLLAVGFETYSGIFAAMICIAGFGLAFRCRYRA